MNKIIKYKEETIQKIRTSCVNFPAQEVSLDKHMEIKYSCGLTAFVSGALRHYTHQLS